MRILTLVLLGMVFVCVQAAVVLAAKNSDTGPGCGLGTLAWADYKHPKNIAPQVMMATTNGSLFNTVGISFGLSGCTNDGTVMAERKGEIFVAVTFEDLAQDMAQGKGEHLASLVTLMRVPADRHAEFFAMAQEKYTTLLAAGEVSPLAVVKALYQAMDEHPILAQVPRSY